MINWEGLIFTVAMMLIYVYVLYKWSEEVADS